ncbi:hypothetical protein DCC35_16545 [Mangrovivirga cuniculi]|uniref:eCIS core domain-containing protein n=2 Tax=Mangrovivirga cuniculi TaxID=2715131 RepID=A0A4D7JXC8_9BACT|nr:hypothetical protein DCC35_16545 [Mangrovivirga cuniculi]
MENSFGTSFSDVNVHKDSPEATKMGAKAFAQGNEVHFAPGQYNPDTKSGQELIGHELTHVVQQKQGRVKATTQAKGAAVNDDPALEKEADEMGKKAAEGKKVKEIKSKQENGALIEEEEKAKQEDQLSDEQLAIISGNFFDQYRSNINACRISLISTFSQLTNAEKSKDASIPGFVGEIIKSALTAAGKSNPMWAIGYEILAYAATEIYNKVNNINNISAGDFLSLIDNGFISIHDNNKLKEDYYRKFLAANKNYFKGLSGDKLVMEAERRADNIFPSQKIIKQGIVLKWIRNSKDGYDWSFSRWKSAYIEISTRYNYVKKSHELMHAQIDDTTGPEGTLQALKDAFSPDYPIMDLPLKKDISMADQLWTDRFFLDEKNNKVGGDDTEIEWKTVLKKFKLADLTPDT